MRSHDVGDRTDAGRGTGTGTGSATAPAARQHHRRGDTRRRILDVALELFAEQGYEKTSLREIAEHLGVTKAALYYHFKTKEDIVVGLSEDAFQPLAEVIEWGMQQPDTLDTKLEVLRRYSEALGSASPAFVTFMQDNRAALQDLRIGEMYRGRMSALFDLMRLNDPDADLTDQVRCISALGTMQMGTLAMMKTGGDPEDKRRAVLEVALDLVRQAHRAQ
jgi:AcrR family transcriptional regulator